MPTPDYRFEVAFSFAGRHRDKVRAIAEIVRAELGGERVFFDEWFEHEILGSDMDVLLQRFYHDQSRMVVADLSEDYSGREWTQAEARAIRALRKKIDTARDEIARLRLLNIRLGEGVVPGVLETEGWLDGVHYSPAQCAELIVKRHALLVKRSGGQPPASPTAPGLAENAPTDSIVRPVTKIDRVPEAAEPRNEQQQPQKKVGNQGLGLLGICLGIFIVFGSAVDYCVRFVAANMSSNSDSVARLQDSVRHSIEMSIFDVVLSFAFSAFIFALINGRGTGPMNALQRYAGAILAIFAVTFFAMACMAVWHATSLLLAREYDHLDSLVSSRLFCYVHFFVAILLGIIGLLAVGDAASWISSRLENGRMRNRPTFCFACLC